MVGNDVEEDMMAAQAAGAVGLSAHRLPAQPEREGHLLLSPKGILTHCWPLWRSGAGKPPSNGTDGKRFSQFPRKLGRTFRFSKFSLERGEKWDL